MWYRPVLITTLAAGLAMGSFLEAPAQTPPSSPAAAAAAKRESGRCRLLPQDVPEMKGEAPVAKAVADATKLVMATHAKVPKAVTFSGCVPVGNVDLALTGAIDSARKGWVSIPDLGIVMTFDGKAFTVRVGKFEVTPAISLPDYLVWAMATAVLAERDPGLWKSMAKLPDWAVDIHGHPDGKKAVARAGGLLKGDEEYSLHVQAFGEKKVQRIEVRGVDHSEKGLMRVSRLAAPTVQVDIPNPRKNLRIVRIFESHDQKLMGPFALLVEPSDGMPDPPAQAKRDVTADVPVPAFHLAAYEIPEGADCEKIAELKDYAVRNVVGRKVEEWGAWHHAGPSTEPAFVVMKRSGDKWRPVDVAVPVWFRTTLLKGRSADAPALRLIPPKPGAWSVRALEGWCEVVEGKVAPQVPASSIFVLVRIPYGWDPEPQEDTKKVRPLPGELWVYPRP